MERDEVSPYAVSECSTVSSLMSTIPRVPHVKIEERVNVVGVPRAFYMTEEEPENE